VGFGCGKIHRMSPTLDAKQNKVLATVPFKPHFVAKDFVLYNADLEKRCPAHLIQKDLRFVK